MPMNASPALLHSLLTTVRQYPLVWNIWLFFGWLVAAKVVDLLIDRFGRRLAARTKVAVDDQLIDLVHQPLCWSLVIMGLLFTIGTLIASPPWSTLVPSILQTILLILWWITAFKISRTLLVPERMQTILQRGKIGQDLLLLMKKLFAIVIVVVAVLLLLNIWHIDLMPLFASAGIAGIAVALAAKDSLANFFGGLSIFMDRTYKIGDYIILDSGERGEVVEVGIRSTRIQTRDDILITIPNSIMANSKIINESAPIPRFRVRVPVGVAYGSDLAKVEHILLAVAHANPSVVKEPAPRVRLRAFNNSSVDFELLLWIKHPSLKGLETHHLLGAIYQAFREADITIPYPQLDVHLVPADETL